MFVAIINKVSALGWLILLLLIQFKFLISPSLYSSQNILPEVYLLKFLQSFQLFDLILIILKKTSGSLPASIAQITGRLVVTWYFVEITTEHYAFAHMVTCWAIADLVKYLHYLFKNSVTKVLRYNLFIILYPIGVWGEMKVINDYIRRYA
jgi:very-long-chain (3R)-3-hydroxyacyl-CoA dehydratase